MHISEGVLSAPVLAGGALFAVGGLAFSLRRLAWENIMSVGVLSSAFFVASLVHVPLGPGSVHLILNGLIGAILGWPAFAAVAVALFLQALLFQFGGLTSLGVNICIMAWPAVVCGLAFRHFFKNPRLRAPAAFACGVSAVLLSGLLCALGLALSGEAFFTVASAVFLAHVPVMILEGLLTALIIGYLIRVMPELLTLKKS